MRWTTTVGRMIRSALRRLRGGTPARVDADLAHALKNDVVGKVNHFGVTLEHQVAAVHENLTQQTGLLGARLGSVEELAHRQAVDVADLGTEVDLVNKRLIELLDRLSVTNLPLSGHNVDPELALMLNRARAADGPLRERGLFLNGPLNIQWYPDGPRLVEINERIIEYPYVLERLAPLESGARVLDVGGGESTLGLGLASRGFSVDLVEPGGVPFHHPDLTVHTEPVEAVDGLQRPDAIVLLSTIEHIGIGAYGHDVADDHDLTVMRHLWDLAGPGTVLVLTTPFGHEHSIDDLQRTYDLDRLTRLLSGWLVDDRRLALQIDAHTWSERAGLDLAGHRGRAAALISAVRAESADAPPW